VRFAIEIGKGLFDTGEKFIGGWKAKPEGDGVGYELRRKLHGSSGENNGAASGLKFFGEFAKTAADFVVFEVAGKILEEKNAVALNEGDVAESRFGGFTVVDGRAVKAGEAGGYAPNEKRDREVGGNIGEERLDAFLFGTFDGDDGMTRIDEQAEFVALGERFLVEAHFKYSRAEPRKHGILTTIERLTSPRVSPRLEYLNRR
jgi:hypothetical protein